MDNEGFRRLLLEERRVVSATGKQRDQKNDQKNDQGGGAEQQERHAPRTNKALEEINAKYVDRAELRRKGVEDLGEDPVEMKGLDFSLIAKARAERALQARTSQGVGHQRQGDCSRSERSADALPSARASPSGRSNQGRQLAQAIEAALLEVTKEAQSQLRASLASTSYVYVAESDKYEVPVIRKRALNGVMEVSPEEAGRAAAGRRRLPEAVMGEICAIMRYCGGSKGGKRVSGGTGTIEDGRERRPDGALSSAGGKPQVAPLQTMHEEDGDRGGKSGDNSGSDEEDIFGDAGTDYVPEAKKKPDVSAAKPSTYFSESAAVPSPAGRDDIDEDMGRGTNAEDGIAGEEKRSGSLRAERMVMQSDGYDECYPGYDGGVDVASDVDEEPEEQAPVVMTKKARKIANRKEQARLEDEMNSIQKVFEQKSWTGFEDNREGRQPPKNAVPKKKRRI